MEHPNTTWNDFSTHLINKDVSYQISTSLLSDEEQKEAQITSLGQEIKNLRTELKEHRVNALEGNQRPVDANQKGRQNATRFCGYCRTNGHTPNYCSAVRRCGMKKSRSCRMKPQQRKRLRSPKITTRDVEVPTDLGIGLVGTTVMGLWCQPHDHSLEEISGQVIKILTTFDKMGLPSEATIRITKLIDTMTTQQDHHTSQIKTNPGIGEVITLRDRFQRHDKIRLLRILVDNSDQTHLTLRCLTVVGIGTRVTIYLTKRNFQILTTVISQT